MKSFLSVVDCFVCACKKNLYTNKMSYIFTFCKAVILFQIIKRHFILNVFCIFIVHMYNLLSTAIYIVM